MNQRLAVCIVPADGATPRALLYTGNVIFGSEAACPPERLRLGGAGVRQLH